MAASTRASEAVRRLLDMQPATARVIRNGEEVEVSIDEDLASSVQDAGYIATVKNRQALDEMTKPGSPESSNGLGDTDFDLMVIGGGSAGFAAAIKAALNQVIIKLLEGHTETCVKECAVSGDIEALERIN